MPVKLTAKSCTKLVTRRTKMTLVLLLFGLSTWLNVVDGELDYTLCFYTLSEFYLRNGNTILVGSR